MAQLPKGGLVRRAVINQYMELRHLLSRWYNWKWQCRRWRVQWMRFGSRRSYLTLRMLCRGCRFMFYSNDGDIRYEHATSAREAAIGDPSSWSWSKPLWGIVFQKDFSASVPWIFVSLIESSHETGPRLSITSTLRPPVELGTPSVNCRMDDSSAWRRAWTQTNKAPCKCRLERLEALLLSILCFFPMRSSFCFYKNGATPYEHSRSQVGELYLSIHQVTPRPWVSNKLPRMTESRSRTSLWVPVKISDRQYLICRCF